MTVSGLNDYLQKEMLSWRINNREVTFDIDANSIVQVHAKDKSTNKDQVCAFRRNVLTGIESGVVKHIAAAKYCFGLPNLVLRFKLHLRKESLTSKNNLVDNDC